MSLRIVPGSANLALAQAIAKVLGTEPLPGGLERFPDGELRPVVAHLRGDDVYVVQPTGPPVSDHLLELFLLLDACRRAGAKRITDVVPYFGYARQDRRSQPGEPVGARVVADALAASGAQRLVVIDPHTAALEAMCGIPVEMLTAVPALARALAPDVPGDAVVVAPDLGAVKLAEHYASLLQRPVAVVRKTRVTGAIVRAEEIAGDVADRPTVIVDDMISTGATMEAAAQVVLAHGGTCSTVAATHGLLVGGAGGRLRRLPIRRVVTTDSLPPGHTPSLALHVESVAALLADAISSLYHDQPLAGLRAPA
jgi:ribose-phosphate pyrophosphokinase